MASIVKLNETSDQKLAEMLENSREELFNLRFQQASARLEDVSRVRKVRREIAQLETVLQLRRLAIAAAAAEPTLADQLAGVDWRADARFNYEESAWQVSFLGADDKEIAGASVDLNRKKRAGRRKSRSPQAGLLR